MDELLKSLDGVDMGALKKLNDATKAASQRRAANGGKEPIRDQVTARLGLAYMGTAMQAIGRALTGPTMPSASLSTPPIATGLTITMQRIHDVIMKHQSPSESEYKEVRLVAFRWVVDDAEDSTSFPVFSSARNSFSGSITTRSSRPKRPRNSNFATSRILATSASSYTKLASFSSLPQLACGRC